MTYTQFTLTAITVLGAVIIGSIELAEAPTPTYPISWTMAGLGYAAWLIIRKLKNARPYRE